MIVGGKYEYEVIHETLLPIFVTCVDDYLYVNEGIFKQEVDNVELKSDKVHDKVKV